MFPCYHRQSALGSPIISSGGSLPPSPVAAPISPILVPYPVLLSPPRWYRETLAYISPPQEFTMRGPKLVAPDRSGCYVFTATPEISPEACLYVGRASDSLQTRLASYRHKGGHMGRQLLQDYLKQGHQLYVHVVACAAHQDLEASLQDLLSPQFISRYEGRILGDDESLLQYF